MNNLWSIIEKIKGYPNKGSDMNKKYQVFISSTFTDLKEERKKVIEILLSADCIPSGMEAFVATDNEQFNVIKKVIDYCDYYILIIGNRYGSENNSTGLSYTEMEYDYAKSKNIPVLVFAIDLTSRAESDNPEKLKAFRKKAMENRLCSIWKDIADLVGKVAIAITNAKSEIPRSGWQHATEFDETSLLKQIVQLKNELETVKKENLGLAETINSFTETSDLAFEDGMILIYYKYVQNSHEYTGFIQTDYESLFKYISLELLEIPQDEYSINIFIKKFVEIEIKEDVNRIVNTHLVRELMIQYRGLNLVESMIRLNQNNEEYLCWGLTAKGKSVNEELTMVKKIPF